MFPEASMQLKMSFTMEVMIVILPGGWWQMYLFIKKQTKLKLDIKMANARIQVQFMKFMDSALKYGFEIQVTRVGNFPKTFNHT